MPVIANSDINHLFGCTGFTLLVRSAPGIGNVTSLLYIRYVNSYKWQIHHII